MGSFVCVDVLFVFVLAYWKRCISLKTFLAT